MGYDHNALLVGDETTVRTFLTPGLESIPLRLVFSDSGEKALDQMQSAKTPFALVISDQRLPGMTGTKFLEQAKKQFPDVVCLLLTRYSDMKIIMDSVNKGAVHRYILKTREDQDCFDAIMTGLKQYEIQEDARGELEKAKALNKRLHQLDSQLIDSTKALDQAHAEIDLEIVRLEEKIKTDTFKLNPATGQMISRIETVLTEKQGLTIEKIDQLFSHTIKQVFGQFGEAAKRSGFQMPRPKADNVNEKE